MSSFRTVNINSKDWLFIFVITVMYINSSLAGGTHVHGQAHMNIVLVEQNLTINVILSAQDVVGFERMPGSESENQNILDAIEKLSLTEEWLLFKKGSCKKENVLIVNPFTENHDHSEHSEHFNFEASVDYICQKPENFAEIQIKLKQIYSQIQDIEIQWLVHNKQGLEHLHGNETEVRFK